MANRPLLVSMALAVAFWSGRAEAQGNRNVNPLRFNTPTAQAGMFNNNDVLRFNNPLNQAGMYGNNAVLRYDNPLNQVGMYNTPALQYNNPLMQGNMYGTGGVNYGGSFNGFNTGSFNTGSSSTGRVTSRTRTSGNLTTHQNGPAVINGPYGAVGAVSGGFYGAGGGFFPMNNPMYQGNVFGWGAPNPMGLNNMGMGNPGLLNQNGPNGFSDGQRVGDRGKSNAEASSILNGLSSSPGHVAKGQTKASPKAKAKSARSTRKRSPVRH